MKSLSREQWIALILSVALTLGTVGYMFVKSNELAEATERGKAERINNLDLAPPKQG